MIYAVIYDEVDLLGNSFYALVTSKNKQSIIDDMEYHKSDKYKEEDEPDLPVVIKGISELFEEPLTEKEFVKEIVNELKTQGVYSRTVDTKGRGDNGDLNCYYIYIKK